MCASCTPLRAVRYTTEAQDTDDARAPAPPGGGPDDPRQAGGPRGRCARGEDEAGADAPVGRRGFPADVARFLGVLSQAVQQHSMYPPAHPALGTVVGSVMDALEPVLSSRPVLSIGIASRQLTVEGVESSPDHPRLGFLACRLHRHHLSSVSFDAGVSATEVAEFLARVGREPELGEPALGRTDDEERPGWVRLRVQPIRYDHLRLARGRSEALGDGGADEGRPSRLWLGLARAALVSEATGTGGGRPDHVPAAGDGEVEALARAVEEYASERTYAEEVLSHLVSITRELRGASGEQAAALRKRTSRLVSLVQADTLREVLRSGGDSEGRRQLLLDSCQWMEPASVVKLVRATAGVERRDLSHWLLLMMSKLARHASSGSIRARAEAEANLRDQVARLVDDWALDDAVPDDYGATLERMSRTGTPSAPDEGGLVSVDPERVLMMGLEVGRAGSTVLDAVGELVRAGRISRLLEILDSAPDGCAAADAVWERVSDPELAERILAEPDPDFETLDRLVARLGARAAGPMLETLAESEDRAVRRRLFSLLARLGPDAAPLVARKMDRDDRWYVKRNMLALMAEYDRWPRKWSPATYAEHPHPAVRREALKLMLRVDALRDAAIAGLLEDRNPRALSLGLAAAQEEVPPDTVTLLATLVEDPALRPDLRRSGLRALVASRRPEALPVLLDLCRRPVSWPLRLLGLRRLAEKSPLVLEALAGLYRGWRHEPTAKRLLARASRSPDPQVRAAARGVVDGEEAA